MRFRTAALLLITATTSLAGLVEVGQGGTLATNRPFCGS